MNIEWLWKRTKPLYAQTLVWVTLGSAYWLAFGEPNYYTIGEPTNDIVTYLAFLPNEFVRDRLIYTIVQWLFAGFGLLWILQRGLPYTSWGATLCFTTLISLFQENIFYHDHIFQVTNMILIVLCFWYHFAASEIKASLREGRFWTTLLVPNWVVYLSIFYISVYYAFVGWHKVWVSGFDWINGVSLQLWILSWDRDDYFPNSWIVQNVYVAAFAQAFTLFAEGFAFLGLFNKTWRTVMGVSLVAFHIGQEWVFDFDFESNLVMVAYVYLPFAAWLECLDSKVPKSTVNVESRLGRFCTSRFDLFGMTKRKNHTH